MMNAYRIAGDAVHLLAFVILLAKLWIFKSSAGVSAKTQILYTLVFSTRYLDMFVASFVAYLNVYKAAYLFLSYLILLSVFAKFRKTYDKDSDSFRFEFLIFAALGLALACNYRLEPIEVLWTFSEYLECVAAWPQFYMVVKTKKVRAGMFLYLLAVGVYRILYIQNWIYKYYATGRYDPISDISGTVQVVPYFAFWILCLIGVVKVTGEKTSWFVQNLVENDQNAIFTIKVPLVDSQDRTSRLPLLANAVDVVPDGGDAAKV